MSSPLVYLVTGCTRGIGRAYVEQLVKKHRGITVVAAVRNPEDGNAISLAKTVNDSGNRLVAVKLDSRELADPAKMVKELADKYSIERLDVVLANAGSNLAFAPLLNTDAAKFTVMTETNATGPLVLFQAVKPLLLRSSLPGKFIYVGSSGGSIANLPTFAETPFTAYFASKAAGHYLMRVIRYQNPELCIGSVCPGMVLTGLGTEALKEKNMDASQFRETFRERGAVEPEVCGEAMVWAVDHATKENFGDELISVVPSYKEKKWSVTPW